MKYSGSYSLLTNCLSALAPKKGDQRERGVTHQGLSNIILMGGKTDTPITFYVLFFYWCPLSLSPSSFYLVCVLKRPEENMLLLYHLFHLISS